MNRRVRRRAGFTIIEVLAVILVIGLAAGMAAVSIGGGSGRGLKGAARDLSTAVKVIYAVSATQRTAYRLVYDFKEGTYSLRNALIRGDTLEWVECDGCVPDFGGRRALPEGVRFREIQTLHDERPVSQGETWSELTGTGFVEPTILHLIDDNKRELTLQVMPLTGTVRVFDGYQKFQK